MSRLQRRIRRGLAKSLTVAVGGTLFIPLLPSCETALTILNPCGSVFGFCDPRDIDLIFADIPDFDLDPTCTIPFGGAAVGCDDSPFPLTPGPRPEPGG